jgi:poly-beta-hydroxybutyrate-responsive repressor
MPEMTAKSTPKATGSRVASRASKPGREEPQGGLPRNYLRASLLLLIGEAPVHGYDLLEQIAGLGLHTIDAGGLYRALRVMEGEGIVASTWEHSASGPARRTYRLTGEGREWLHAWAGALRETHRYLSSYLDRYDGIVQSDGIQSDGIVQSSRVEAPK